MGGRKRSSRQGADRTERWLGSERGARSRPWAYEELLFGEDSVAGVDDELSTLADELALDLRELERLQHELFEQVMTIAELEGRVEALLRTREAIRPEAPTESADESEIRTPPSAPVRVRTPLERGSALARCEGFRVDSPGGTLGFVEGVRFASRIDQPDVLEVRGGRFGRQLLLIPIEDVAEISPTEERLVVRSAPEQQDDAFHELVNRLRNVLHHAAS